MGVIDDQSIASFLEDDRYLLRDKARQQGPVNAGPGLSYNEMNDIFSNLSLQQQQQQAAPGPMSNSQLNANEMAAAWTAAVDSPQLQQHLHRFLQSVVTRQDFRVVSAQPGVGIPPNVAQQMLSPHQQQCIRNRTSILGRQLLADRGSNFADDQVNALLMSIGIGEIAQQPLQHVMQEPLSQRLARFDSIYEEVDGAKAQVHLSQQRPDLQEQFQAAWNQNQRINAGPGNTAWANEFQEKVSNGTVAATEQVDNVATNVVPGEAVQLDSTRQLMEAMESESDPRFRQSKFLQFISKMSRGELVVDGNNVKDSTNHTANAWANEFSEQRAAAQAEVTRSPGLSELWTCACEYTKQSLSLYAHVFNVSKGM